MIESLSELIGRFVGRGNGEYPNVQPFTYNEEATFSSLGSVIAFGSKSWNDEGKPLHSESGFFRMEDELEFVCAHSFGVVELSTGFVQGPVIELESVSVDCAPSAKLVSIIKRTMLVTADRLTYELDMAAMGEGLQFHLAGELMRVAP